MAKVTVDFYQNFSEKRETIFKNPLACKIWK